MKRVLQLLFTAMILVLNNKNSNSQAPVVVTNPTLNVTVSPTPPPAPISQAAFEALDMEIVSADFKSGIWTFSGYTTAGGTTLQTSNVELGYNHVYNDWGWSPRFSFAIVTVPFKVRKAIDTFPQTVQASLANVGLGVNVWNRQFTRYLSNGGKSVHRLGAGLILAPSFEDITPATTKNYVNKNSKQLFISTAINFNYTYNDISFFLIPIGIDFGTTNDGKHYIYHKRRWWGIGIGLSTKLLGWR